MQPDPMNFEELKAKAKELKIVGYALMKEATLIKKIEEATADPANSDSDPAKTTETPNQNNMEALNSALAENAKLKNEIERSKATETDFEKNEPLYPFTDASGRIGLYRRMHNRTNIPPNQNLPAGAGNDQAASPYVLVKWQK